MNAQTSSMVEMIESHACAFKACYGAALEQWQGPEPAPTWSNLDREG